MTAPNAPENIATTAQHDCTDLGPNLETISAFVLGFALCSKATRQTVVRSIPRARAFLSRSAGIKIGKKYSAGNTDLRGIHGREPFASVLGSIGRLETLKPCGCCSYERHHAKNLDSVGPNKLKKQFRQSF